MAAGAPPAAWAILVAAGGGTRFGGDEPKVLHALGGSPVLAHSLAALRAAPSIERIVVVVPGGRGVREAAERLCAGRDEVVTGGSTRQASVLAGLERVPPEVRRVVVHDAARPLVTVELVEAVLAALDRAGAALCAVPVTDTLKEVSAGAEGDRVSSTLARRGLWRAQTPQAFRTEVLRRAHARAAADGFEATDDAMLVERLGEPVVVVPGLQSNVKITTPDDLALAEALLAAGRMEVMP